MDSFKQQWLTWIIILSAAAVCVSCQELTSTLREGNQTCQGEEVIFYCTIRGSLGLGWSSPGYINDNNALQFSPASMIEVDVPSRINGMITATARLTTNTMDNGEQVLQSTLRITATEASTVTCSGPSGDPASIEFSVSAVPGVPQRINARENSPPVGTTCIILVTWSPPANIDSSDIDQYYIVYVPSRNIRDVSSSTISTFTVPNCGDDTRVQIAAVNRVGCVGMNSSEVQLTLLDIPTGPTDSGSATTEGGSATTEGVSPPTSSQLSVGTAVGITIAVILPTLCFLGLVFGCIYRICVAGKATKVEEVFLHEISMIRREDFRKNLMDLYIALKKDLSKDDKLSSLESLSQMMENRTLSKQYIKEAVKIALKTIKLDRGGDVKKVLVDLKINIPKVLSSFDNELQDKDTDITMANLIRAAEQNVHEEVFDKLIEIMDNSEPEIVEGLLRTMFEKLQKWVTNLPGEKVNMEFPTS